MNSFTITLGELNKIRCQVFNSFCTLEKVFSNYNLHKGGYKSMKDGDELLSYVHLLDDILAHKYIDDNYDGILSNEDFWCIVKRVKELENKNRC